MKKWLQNIENKAQDLLQDYGYIGMPLALDVYSFAQIHGFNIKEYNFSDSELNFDSISGALIIQNGIKTIGIKETESLQRRRFTIAHELGHYFLNHGMRDGIKLDTYKLYRNNDSSAGSKEEEVQANAFAAALLMPKEYLNIEFNKLSLTLFDDLKIIYELATSFDVSVMAMSFRLNRLELMETDKYIF
jgi:Zn-dependent peptidase ImmA (M78 family)